MKAVVTGANGFLGSAVVRTLLALEDNVVALVGPSGRLNGLAGLDVPTLQGDIQDKRFVERACEGADVIFHTASLYDFRDRQAAEMKAVALCGVDHVMAAARQGGRRVVLTSSASVLGFSKSPEVLDEDHPGILDRSDLPPYIATKAELEVRALRLAEELGIELVVASPTVIVGPYDFRPGPSNGLILDYLVKPVRHSYVGGINVVSVRDVARGHRLLAMVGSAGERYILGGQNVDYGSFHATIAELAGLPKPCFQAGRAYSDAVARMIATVGLESYFSPFVSNEQVRLIEKYFWYTHQKAGALGYTATPARRAVAQALGWLVMTPHITAEQRRSLRLADAVHRERQETMPEYRRLLCPTHSGP